MPADRLYYRDAFLRNFSARVTAVRGQSVALNRTAFYPTSGGQPFDTGSIGSIKVESVEEDDQGEVWHTLPEPVEIGTEVAGEIDWHRRFDHMQQHTGQHLLSAVFAAELNAPTVSFHLGESTSNIDLAHGPLSSEQLAHVEHLANQIIAENRPANARVVPRTEAEAMLAAGRLRKLPEREGDIRLIEIADCDLNACGGTHVSATGQIGILWLRGTEKISRGVRVHFVCGLRALRTARADAAVLAQAASALSVGTENIPAAIDHLKLESKALSKDRQRLRESLADAEAASMLTAAKTQPEPHIIEAACPGRDRDYVRLLASRITAQSPATVVILSSSEPTAAWVVLARGRDLALDCNAVMKPALAQRGLRGGGSPDLAQAEVTANAAAELRTALAAASTH